MLTHFGISRQAQRQALQRQRVREGQAGLIVEMVRGVRYHHPRLGTRKLLVKLRSQLSQRGLAIGRDRLFSLLRAHDLLVTPKRRRSKTTRRGLWRCPNRLGGLNLSAPQQLWVADITYLITEQGFLYLALLTDAYSRFIVGFDLCATLAVEGAQRALAQALRQYPIPNTQYPIPNTQYPIPLP